MSNSGPTMWTPNRSTTLSALYSSGIQPLEHPWRVLHRLKRTLLVILRHCLLKYLHSSVDIHFSSLFPRRFQLLRDVADHALKDVALHRTQSIRLFLLVYIYTSSMFPSSVL